MTNKHLPSDHNAYSKAMLRVDLQYLAWNLKRDSEVARFLMLKAPRLKSELAQVVNTCDGVADSLYDMISEIDETP